MQDSLELCLRTDVQDLDEGYWDDPGVVSDVRGEHGRVPGKEQEAVERGRGCSACCS